LLPLRPLQRRARVVVEQRRRRVDRHEPAGASGGDNDGEGGSCNEEDEEPSATVGNQSYSHTQSHKNTSAHTQALRTQRVCKCVALFFCLYRIYPGQSPMHAPIKLRPLLAPELIPSPHLHAWLTN
jgi:hypothetical protein